MTGEAAGSVPARFEPRLAAVFWMLAAATAWAGIGIAVRYLGGRLPPTDLSFYRSIAGVLLLLPVIWPHRRAIVLSGFRRPTMLLFGLRGALLFGGQAAFYFSLAYIPLAEATVLNCTLPVFVAVLAVLILRERVTAMGWSMIALGFVGIVIILRPGVAAIHVAAPFAVLAAFLFASASITNKVLSRTEPASRIVFFSNVLILICGTVPFALFAVMPRWSEVPLILIICVLGTVAQYCIARALALEDASFVGPMEFIRVPLAALAGWLLFAEFPDIWVWIGSAVVLVSIVFLTHSHRTSAPVDAAP